MVSEKISTTVDDLTVMCSYHIACAKWLYIVQKIIKWPKTSINSSTKHNAELTKEGTTFFYELSLL